MLWSFWASHFSPCPRCPPCFNLTLEGTCARRSPDRPRTFVRPETLSRREHPAPQGCPAGIVVLPGISRWPSIRKRKAALIFHSPHVNFLTPSSAYENSHNVTRFVFHCHFSLPEYPALTQRRYNSNNSEGKRMVSRLIRNQLPSNGLRVRLPCPPPFKIVRQFAGQASRTP